MARTNQEARGNNKKNKRAATDAVAGPEVNKQMDEHKVKKPEHNRKVKKQKQKNGGTSDKPVIMIKAAEPTFLGLPRELRDEIYKLVIGGHEVSPCFTNSECEDIKLPAGPYNVSGETEQQWDDMFNLSLVCHQLNAETKDLPYKFSVFQASLGTDLTLFMKLIKTDKKRLITTLSFGLKEHHNFSVETIEDLIVGDELYGCTALQTVISRITLNPVQKWLVKDFATAMGAKIVYENEHLGYVDDCEEEQMEEYYAMLEGGSDEEDWS